MYASYRAIGYRLARVGRFRELMDPNEHRMRFNYTVAETAQVINSGYTLIVRHVGTCGRDEDLNRTK